MGKRKATIGKLVRFTPEDWAHVQSLMEKGGYRCFAVFARDCILRKELRYKRGSFAESEVLLRLLSELRHIGVNYNQVVHRINTLAEETDGAGRPRITNGALTAMVDRLQQLTRELIDVHMTTVREVKKAESRGDDSI